MYLRQSNSANQVSSPASLSQYTTFTSSPLPLNQASDVPQGSTNTARDGAQIQTGQSTLHWNSLERNLTTNRLTPGDYISKDIASSDLWSAAYREAVESLGEEIDPAALEGKNIAQLFRELEDIEKEVTHESAFVRGVRYLDSLQVPLENFKLGLDLAAPLANLEPTATTVVGVVRAVTAVSSVHSVEIFLHQKY